MIIASRALTLKMETGIGYAFRPELAQSDAQWALFAVIGGA
jgi:hypothetical protein